MISPSCHSKRNLLTEISALITAHEMYMGRLDEDNQLKVTKKKEYCRSPLGKEIQKESDIPTMPPVIDNDSEQPENFKFRKYKNNNEIAHHCQKLLKVTAYPSVAQITVLIHQINSTLTPNTMESSSNELNTIRSIILQWFRKRREYLASKVYSVCDELMGDIWMSVLMRCEASGILPISYDSTVEEIISDDSLMKGIFHASDLPIKDEENGINFVKRKVKDYFTKLCSKVPINSNQ